MQSRGCFASAFALKTFNGVKLCGHLLWSEASILHKDIYICCMENCGILYVAVILHTRMWIEIRRNLNEDQRIAVILHTRMWIEIQPGGGGSGAGDVILHARMWIGIAPQCLQNMIKKSHPPCEDVD